MIFYTADLHFGSEEQAEKRKNHFASVDEMDERLVDNWNAAVSPDDTVYLIGDLTDHSLPLPEMCLSRLSGHKYLIRGNHDAGMEQQERLYDYFESVSDYYEITDSGYNITLCHYPLVYLHSGYMIHGHIHRPVGTAFGLLQKLPKVLNAGVDLNDYRPATLAELLQNNTKYYGDREQTKPTPASGQREQHRKWKAEFRPIPPKTE